MAALAVRIRFAERRDAEALAGMVRELLVDLGDGTEAFDAVRFTTDAFGDRPQFSVLIAERGSEALGYALFHDAYEPCYAARGVYLCDLYVRPAARRQGLGRRLMAAVARDARDRGRSFIWWVVRSASDTAKAFYRTLTNAGEPVTAQAVAFDAFDRLAAAGGKDSEAGAARGRTS